MLSYISIIRKPATNLTIAISIMITLISDRLRTQAFLNKHITNNITETDNQTINYIDNGSLNDNKIATVIVNPTSLTENCLWIPEVSGNVVPGLGSMIIYTQSKYATIGALQNAINNITNNSSNGIANIQTEIDNLEINNQQMSVIICHIIFIILILCIKEIILKTIIVDRILHSKASSHINEKVIKSYRFKH